MSGVGDGVDHGLSEAVFLLQRYLLHINNTAASVRFVKCHIVSGGAGEADLGGALRGGHLINVHGIDGANGIICVAVGIHGPRGLRPILHRVAFLDPDDVSGSSRILETNEIQGLCLRVNHPLGLKFAISV